MVTQSVKIELFGIPRLRAGVAEFFVQIETPCSLGDVLKLIEEYYPELGRELLENGQFRKEFIVNISGKRFTKTLEDPINESDSILIMSSDAGG